jgi:AcrR family transcriptional regulator
MKTGQSAEILQAGLYQVISAFGDTAESSKILETATKKFKKYGIHSLNMDDLAKFCSVSKKTIYKYFQNKSDLIEKIFDKKTDCLKRDLKELNSVSKNAVNEIYCFFNMINEMVNYISPVIYRDLKKYHLNLFIKYNHLKDDVYKPFLLKNIERGQQEKNYKEDLNEQTTTNTAIEIIDNLFAEGLQKNKEYLKTLTFFESMLLHKMVTIKGFKKLNELIEN